LFAREIFGLLLLKFDETTKTFYIHFHKMEIFLSAQL